MDLCDAINNRRVIHFIYDGLPRVVRPAAYGPHVSTGNLLLRGYQVDGQSNTRLPPLWDLFTVDHMIGLEITEDTFDNDPPGYRRGDKHLNHEEELISRIWQHVYWLRAETIAVLRLSEDDRLQGQVEDHRQAALRAEAGLKELIQEYSETYGEQLIRHGDAEFAVEALERLVGWEG